MTRIVVLDDYQGVALDFADWSRIGSEADIEVFRDTLSDEDQLVERLKSFDVIAIMRERTPFPASLLERLPRLRLLVTTGMQNAAIDAKTAASLGITVCGTRSAAHPTSELAFGLMLALARNIVGETASLDGGGWQTTVGKDLNGATLGIIGLGRLGSKMAAYAAPFGMNVVAWSQNLTAQKAEEHGARLVSKEELLRMSDFVTIHLKLSDRTNGLIGRDELALMKRDGYLINTSRGPIVDREALVAALTNGIIAGAALDVFDEEPLPADDPLRHAPNLLMTPHLGYVSQEGYRIFYGETVEAIQSWLDGEPVRVIVSPEG